MQEETFEKMALTATEDWICERIQLKHDNLEDVRSLTLPGTYQDKISHLGHSLRNFLRLKQLDLSRNTLSSLDGLEHLTMLEKLNLYYNNIASLNELHKLRFNSKLEEVDLRLNPVTRDEPDYRLFLIHMLPSLRKLDDRGVRDSERKAALMHFGSSQAHELTEHTPRKVTPEKKSNPRVEMVKNMKKSSVLDDDDVAVLDLIARTGGDLNQARPITGSSASQPAMEEYSPKRLQQIESEEAADYYPKSARSAPSPREVALPPSVTENYPQITEAYQLHARSRPASEAGTPRRDANLKYQDEIEAYTSYKSHGTFTPHPGAGEGQGRVRDLEQHSERDPSQEQAFQPSQSNTVQKLQFSSSSQSGAAEDRFSFLPKLLDLVDKYWNGSKSLHRNKRFINHAESIFSDFLECNPLSSEVTKLRGEVRKLAQENLHLREKNSANSQEKAQDTNIRTNVEQAHAEIECLQQKLKNSIDENRTLRQKLEHSETILAGGGMQSTGGSSVGAHSQQGELQQQNSFLKQEIDTLKIRLKQFSQMQELASMLQQSHKSLVQTNEHLLKEIDDNRQRHEAEVQQLHWSFDQMKKTAGMMPNGSAAPSINGSM